MILFGFHGMFITHFQKNHMQITKNDHMEKLDYWLPSLAVFVSGHMSYIVDVPW